MPEPLSVWLADANRSEFTVGLAVVIVPNPGARISPDEIREFVGSRLAKFKVPNDIAIIEALPRNATNKVMRSEVRDMALAMIEEGA